MRLEADAVLFDNDGVLVDSHPEVMVGWRRLASEFGLDFAELESVLVGVRAADTLSRFLSDDRVDDAVRRLEDLEVELAPATRPLAGAVELCNSLPAGRWTIVTSGSRRLARARWDGAAIPVPDLTVTAEDVVNGKPDPEPFLTGARRLGVPTERCIVFEDSAPGGAAAVAAGAMVVAVGGERWDVTPSTRVTDLTEVVVHSDQAGAGIVLELPDR